MSALTRRWRQVGLAVVIIVAIIFPQVFTNALDTQFGILTLIFVAAAVAWNLFAGFTGYISLGHAVFFGCGAYTVGLLALHWNLLGSQVFFLLPLAGLVGALIAVPFGLICLRVRRHTFVVITIAIFFIVQLMAYNLAFTNGNGGVSTPAFTWSPATFNDPFYYAALILAAGVILLSWLIRGSRFGLQLLAIRDDEDRARGLGVHTMRAKLTALVISASVTGMIGGLWFFFVGQVLPETGFDPNYDLAIALMSFFGGFGTLAGPIVGAILLEPLQQYVILQFPNGYTGEILLGALLLLVILFLSRGLLPTAGEWITSLRARGERRHQEAVGAGAPPDGVPVVTGAAGRTGAGGESGLSNAGGAQ